MSKPWDKLRRVAPMEVGVWCTEGGAEVMLNAVRRSMVELDIGSANCFGADDLLQLADFCHELAEQLEADG